MSGAMVSRSHWSEPAAESITPIACQVPGTAWQNTCARACVVGAICGERGEHHARRSQDDRRRPRSVDTDAERGRCTVSGTGRHGNSGRRGPGDRRRLEHRGKPGQRDLERVEHLVAPPTPRDVEEERSGGVGHVDGVFAGKPEPDVVLGEEDVSDAAI